MTLEKAYRKELLVLEDLFRRETVASSLPRLNEIHRYTERKWREYVRRLPDSGVQYLLIAEAPPWTAEGRPLYMLDPQSPSRTLMRALRTALTPKDAQVLGADSALAAFARMGFLVIDSLPFAMSYSGRRASPHYSRLVELAARSYLRRKLDSVAQWSADLRIAFSMERNALTLMRCLDGRLEVGGKQLVISPKMIATNGAHNPDGVQLRRIYRVSSRPKKLTS
jgi:hypothetical protein